MSKKHNVTLQTQREIEDIFLNLSNTLRTIAQQMKDADMTNSHLARSKRAHKAHQLVFAAMPNDPNEALAILASCFAAAAIGQGVPYQQADRVFNTAFQELHKLQRHQSLKDLS